jgi:hypothetical protein
MAVSGMNNAVGPSSTEKLIVEEEIDADLTPFLEFLNTNFEVLTDNLEEGLAFSVIKRVWSQILLDLESFLVPDLHSDVVEKPLDEKHLAIVQHTFTVRYFVFLVGKTFKWDVS